MLKIANWNLERVQPKQIRFKRIEAVISDISADIWILTESHKDIGPKYSAAVTSLVSEEGLCWSSIWSHFLITPLIDFVSDKERCTAAKVIHPQYGNIIIYAPVLPWVGSTWHDQPWQGGQAFISALEMYRHDWEQLQLAYPDTIHVVAGDFNQSLVDWHYYGSKKIREKLEQAIEKCNMRIMTEGKLDPVARDSKPQACIDHICMMNSKIKQIRSTKRFPNQANPDKKLSDHFGIVIDVEI